MLETRSAASTKQRKDTDASKPNDHKCAQIGHVKSLSRDKVDTGACLVMFHLTCQITDFLTDSWFPRSFKEKTVPMNQYLKSLGRVLMSLKGIEQGMIDKRMESILRMQ